MHSRPADLLQHEHFPCRCHLSSSTERPDVRYSLVAVDFLPPAVIGETLHKVAGRLSSGELRPLRHISHSMGSVAAAFRQMIQVGQLLLLLRCIDA